MHTTMCFFAKYKATDDQQLQLFHNLFYFFLSDDNDGGD